MLPLVLPKNILVFCGGRNYQMGGFIMNSVMIDVGSMNKEVKMLMDVLFGHLDTLQPSYSSCYCWTATEMLYLALPQAETLKCQRGFAYTLLGLVNLIEHGHPLGNRRLLEISC